MSNVTDYLDRVQARVTVPDPHGADEGCQDCDTLRLVAALRAVLNLHYKDDRITHADVCYECNRADRDGLDPTLWPCPTVQAITEALEVE